ncbi:TolC family protein [Paludibacterium denitrificans]
MPARVAPPLSGSSACPALTEREQIDLATAVDQALCHNPQSQSAWASIRAQAMQVGVAESAYLPTISASIRGCVIGRVPPRLSSLTLVLISPIPTMSILPL